MIIHYISEETRKKYEGTIEKEKKKGSCPDCEIKEIKRSSKEQKKFNVEVVNKDGEEIIKETK